MARSLVVASFVLMIASHLQAGSSPIPFVEQPLVPGSAVPGAHGFELTVKGSGFASKAIVRWNGRALATRFVSKTTLRAAVPGSDLVKPGTNAVTVLNPHPGGGTSNTVFFEVTWATPSTIIFGAPTMVSATTNSLVAGDFNGDGLLDIAASTGATISILLGNGNGTFKVSSFSTTAKFVGTLVSGDFNGDGKLDLAFPDPSTNLLHLLLGNGDGTFTEVSTTEVGADPVCAAVGDFNGDGKLDLAVVNQGSQNLSILLGKGDGTFAVKATIDVGALPNAISVADFNRDGKLDLAVVNSTGDSVSILLGEGNGTFHLKSTPIVGTSPYDLVAADFNGDGIVDLAVSNTCGNAASCDQEPDGSISILLGNGDGTFDASSFVLKDHNEPLAISAGDLNGDGNTDLVVVGSWALIMLGDGKGGFGQPIGMNTSSPEASGYVAVGDFNGDGRLDFAENNPIDIQGSTDIWVQLQSPVAFYPALLTFPPQVVGTTSTPKNMKFENVGIAPLNISTIQSSGSFAQTNDCPATLSIGEDCTITVTFTPTFQGLTGGLILATDDALGATQTSDLVGTGK
jgi:hypothetical protein